MHALLLVAASDHTTSVYEIDVLTVARLCGLLVPLLVGVITKRYASDGLKGVLNLLLSAVSASVGTVLAANHPGDLSIADFFNSTVNAFVTSIITYYGFWKPTGIAGTVAEKTKGLPGFGKEPALETADKGKEDPPAPRKRAPRKRVKKDDGYASYGHVGWVLLVAGLAVWLLLGAGLIGGVLIFLGVALLLGGYYPRT
jgi:hypothetical protein